MEGEKTKRDREQNWDRTEKEIFLQLVQQQIQIIEDKGNDFKKIAGKKAAWEAIRSGMASSGYLRSVEKMRAQWSRMKVSAKKAKTATKKALTATGNMVVIPKVDPADEIVQGMIMEQLEDDRIFIDSDSYIPVVEISANTEDPPVTEFEEYGDIQTDAVTPLDDTIPEETILHLNDIENPNVDTPVGPSTSRDLLSKLRQLPKKPTTKCEVMEARKEQIKKGTAQETERHVLHMANEKEVHKLRVAHMEELQQLKVQKLKIEIEMLKKADQ